MVMRERVVILNTTQHKKITAQINSLCCDLRRIKKRHAVIESDVNALRADVKKIKQTSAAA